MSAVVTKDVISRLPTEIRLAGWLGPTLFTSEVRDGRVVTLAEFRSAFREHTHANSLVLGSVRETQTSTPMTYATFCTEPAGRIVLVDLDPPNCVRFVNSGLEQFLASIAAFVSSWPQLAASDDAAAESTVAEIRAALREIDPVAMSDDDAFWPTSLEMYS